MQRRQKVLGCITISAMLILFLGFGFVEITLQKAGNMPLAVIVVITVVAAFFFGFSLGCLEKKAEESAEYHDGYVDGYAEGHKVGKTEGMETAYNILENRKEKR